MGPRRSPENAGMGLQPLDWQQETLVHFQKNFYREHEEVQQMTSEKIRTIMQHHCASIEGHEPFPKPLEKFEHAGFPDAVVTVMESAGFTTPTAIQAVGWPIALSGYDMVGLAQTGSGKTLAYLLPALVHISAQPPLGYRDGPVALVLAPTRELALQIQMEAFRLGEVTGVRGCCVWWCVPPGAAARIEARCRTFDCHSRSPPRLPRVRRHKPQACDVPC